MTAPDRFVRFFPKSWAKLNASFTPREVVAYVNVLMQYVQREGGLSADNKLLATLADLPMKDWLSLRERLLALGIARIEEDRWVDDDQHENLQRQLKFSMAQRNRALNRQAALREVPRA